MELPLLDDDSPEDAIARATLIVCSGTLDLTPERERRAASVRAALALIADYPAVPARADYEAWSAKTGQAAHADDDLVKFAAFYDPTTGDLTGQPAAQQAAVIAQLRRGWAIAGGSWEAHLWAHWAGPSE